MYADDLVIYGKASVEEASMTFECLQTYCEWTEQGINWEKSSVHFNANTDDSVKRDICQILQMTECSHRDKYLGHNFYNLKSRNEAFTGVIEKMSNKLTG